MPLWAKKEADLNSMAEESKLIKKYHDQWCQNNGYHNQLGRMISKVKAETKWRDIFKTIEEAQKRLRHER